MQYPESTSSFNGLDLSPDSLVRSVLEGIRTSLRDGTELPSLRVVDCEWTESYVHKCRDLGLDEKWISRILASRTRRPVTASLDDNGQVEDLDRELEALSMEAYDSADESDVEDSTDPHAEILTPKYAVVTVRRVPAWPVTSGTGYPGVAAETSTLREGDLILTINDRLVAHMRDLMQVVSTSSSEAAKPVTLRVFRDGAERLLTVPTRILSGVPQPEVVQWAGALFQPPHRAIQFHTKYIPRGVYTSLLYSGSPAQRDGISASWFLVEVDGKPVHDLKSLLEAVEDVEGAAKVPVVDPIGKEGWSKADAEEKEDQSEDKIWETRSYRVKMVSLELVQKVRSIRPLESLCGC